MVNTTDVFHMWLIFKSCDYTLLASDLRKLWECLELAKNYFHLFSHDNHLTVMQEVDLDFFSSRGHLFRFRTSPVVRSYSSTPVHRSIDYALHFEPKAPKVRHGRNSDHFHVQTSKSSNCFAGA